MEKTLEEKIEERKKQAMDRNIEYKAKAVVENLGAPVKYENDDAREEGHYYNNGSLAVSRNVVTAYPTRGFAGRHFVHTFVEYNLERRFESEDDEIKIYIPGKWEKELNKLYKECPVRGKQVAEEYPRELEELQEKAAKFGL